MELWVLSAPWLSESPEGSEWILTISPHSHGDYCLGCVFDTLLLSTARLLWLSPRLNVSSLGREKSRDREGMAKLRFEAKPESGLA